MDGNQLDRLFSVLLAQLEHWAASLSAQDPAGDKTSDQGKSPTSKVLASNGDVEHWRRRWDGCRTEGQRRQLTADLLHVLTAFKRGQANEYGQIPQLTPMQARVWLLETGNYTGVDYRKAAEELGMDEKRVYEIRDLAGLDPRRGLPR
jgi:hypothetical protein